MTMNKQGWKVRVPSEESERSFNEKAKRFKSVFVERDDYRRGGC